jgi:hypothetical protein
MDVVREACWTLSNLTADSEGLITAVMAAGLMPALIAAMRHAHDAVRKEAAWAVSNAITGGTREHQHVIAAFGCGGPLCDVLELHEEALYPHILESLVRILRFGQEGRRCGLGFGGEIRYIALTPGSYHISATVTARPRTFMRDRSRRAPAIASLKPWGATATRT